jgi:NAD(P)-dependent dehydrogenase (short-subunit alcohol dehydrogenase family)
MATESSIEGKLDGKNVVITGAGSGIGASVVAASVKQGAKTIGLDIDATRGKQIVETAGGLFYPCDVSQNASWEIIAKSLASTIGHIDHLHLNAGIQIAPPDAALQEYKFGSLRIDRYRKMMGVNVDGVVLGLHHLLPLMKRGGSIVVTGSLAGVVPYDIDPLYAMSKHAVTGLVRSLKWELRDQGLRINALCPGGIDTGIIPNDQRTDEAIFMHPDHVAGEVMALFETAESGATWAKVATSKPAYIMYPPGKRRD